jgi:hypothetical protein
MTAARRWLLTAAVALVLAGCAVAPPLDASADPSARPSAAVAVPQPGQPFDADAVLDLMRESRRPGGVPDQIETREVAADVAEMLWTIDGQPWEVAGAGASCSLDSCTLELAGRGHGMGGEDVWVFDVGRGPVALVSADLHALPPALAASLDEIVRAADAAEVLDGLIVASARWQPPPDDERFVVAYRAGDEEGSCARDATVEPASGKVEISEGTGC